MDHFSVAKGEHLPSVVFDLRAGLLATARLTHADYDGVPCVDHLFRLEAEIVERFRPLSNEFADLRRTVCGLNLWKRAHVIPLDVLIENREQVLRIRRSGFGHSPPQNLAVLLRQRPPSISRYSDRDDRDPSSAFARRASRRSFAPP